MAGSRNVLAAFVFVQLVLGCSLLRVQADYSGDWYGFGPGLSLDYYRESCPKAEGIISSFIHNAVQEDRTFAAAVLRLHFHDCMIHGCDGSVLIESTPEVPSEQGSIQNNKSLRGFDKVEELKAQLEAACPGVVSCADILAVAARDAVVEVGGETWPVPVGRKDGLVSSLIEANQSLPSPKMNYAALVQNFAAQGLSQSDLVILSGAHTIGKAHCAILVRTDRLYNSTEPGAVDGTDPDLNSRFADRLKQQCPPSSVNNGNAFVQMDPTKGGFTFDNTYYSRLLKGKAVFDSDHALITDSFGAKLVKKEASKNSPFGRDFGNAMIKMGNIPIPAGDSSNIRSKCSAFNRVNYS